jgi:hypothetical protein
MKVDYYKRKLDVVQHDLATVKEAYVKLRDAYVTLAQKAEALETECQSARSVVWAMAKTVGGEVRVPKLVMQAMDETCVINSFYDPEGDVTVIRAANEQPPEKKNGDKQ